MILNHQEPWLEIDLETRHRVLSWSLNCPGFTFADRIAFREVKNSDLPAGLDVRHWLETQLQARQMTGVPTLLTSRQLSAFEWNSETVEDVTVTCVATVGLSNAERIGHRRPVSRPEIGTINIAVQISTGLTEAAQIEALSVATQARTAAVMEAGPLLPEGRATGTGTDCIAIAAPPGDTAFAGLHTALGEALGWSVYETVYNGCSEWMCQRPDKRREKKKC